MDITRTSIFQHPSYVCQVIMVDVAGNPTGEYGAEQVFIKIDGLYYSTDSIKSGAVGCRQDQLKLKYDYESGKEYRSCSPK